MPVYINPRVKRMLDAKYNPSRKNKPYTRRPEKIPKSKAKTKLVRTIRKEIQKNLELKSTTLIGTSGANVRAGGVDDAGLTGYVSRDLGNCSITQGFGVSDRVGNRIKIKKNIIKISLNSLYLAANDAPFRAHIVFYVNKNTNGSGGLAEFMQFQNTAQPQTGSLLREQYPFNKDLFSIKKHIVKKMVYVPAVGTNDINNSTTFSNQVTIDVSKYMPRNWKYDDNDSGQPENAHLFFLCYLTPMNDNLAVAGQPLANIVWTQSLYYTDA